MKSTGTRASDEHYNDVIMGVMASQITSLMTVYSAVYWWRSTKKTSKLYVTGLCEGNSPVTGEFLAQRASYAENVHLARAVMHVGIANPRWRGNRSRHSRRMQNSQFCVSGKRSIAGLDFNMKLYSETTWAVGITQLTHHEVQGGGKIFAPTADRVVS